MFLYVSQWRKKKRLEKGIQGILGRNYDYGAEDMRLVRKGRKNESIRN